jgi:hypothetical protein
VSSQGNSCTGALPLRTIRRRNFLKQLGSDHGGLIMVVSGVVVFHNVRADDGHAQALDPWRKHRLKACRSSAMKPYFDHPVEWIFVRSRGAAALVKNLTNQRDRLADLCRCFSDFHASSGAFP